MRRAYLVCYDIRDDKRLRRMGKLMRGYGDRLQYSVFRCVLGARERVEMQGQIERRIKPSEDAVLIVDLGLLEGRGGAALSTLGLPLPEVENLAFIY
jgi:CRISPR-associated protein Cas2